MDHPKGWKFLKSVKWMDPLEGENSFKSTRVDGSPKRVKVLTSPQKWTDHPKGWKFLQVHKSGRITQKGWKFLKSAKWTDPLEGENSFKSTRVDESPKRVKVFKVRKEDRPPRGWKFFQVHKSRRITQKGWKFLKSTKWTDPLEGENSFKSTRVAGSPKRVKVLKVRKVDGPPRGWKFFQVHT